MPAVQGRLYTQHDFNLGEFTMIRISTLHARISMGMALIMALASAAIAAPPAADTSRLPWGGALASKSTRASPAATPTEILKVSLPPSVNAAGEYSLLNMTITARNLTSGVRNILLTFKHEDDGGKPWIVETNVSWTNALPQPGTVVARLGIPARQFEYNGFWRLERVSIIDAAGYEESPSLPDDTNRVLSVDGSPKAMPPVFEAGGVNLTPSVSLMNSPPGQPTSLGPEIGAKFNVSDPSSIGVAVVRATFCLDGGPYDGECMLLYGTSNKAYRFNKGPLTVGGRTFRGSTTPGIYRLWQLEVCRTNGACHRLGGVRYQFDPGLGQYLDKTTIEVTP